MIFTRAGFKALKFSYVVLIAGLGVAGFIVTGSYLYWQSEKKDDQQSQRALMDLRTRLTSATRDREDLRGSEDTYKELVNRGVFIAEERFDLIEALAALKARHQLVTLTYDIAPQRPLRLATATTYTGVEIMATRIKMKIQALHDADLVSFLDEFPRLQRGFFPLERCVIKRNADTSSPAVSAATPAGDEAAPTSPAALAAAATAARTTLLAKLDAECSFEWVTLRAKGGTTSPVGGVAPGARPS
ncbi:MAG: hypothetical protein ABI583_11205 [Betaproteobacteria bacterium]